MKPERSRRPAPDPLASVIADYQSEVVIPHCARCAKPCCKLDALVLDLSWKQFRTIWRIEESRADFDRRLEAGQGPTEIRAAKGRYYAHTKACPAYDLEHGTCGVYNLAAKPRGCSDFPVYQDGDYIVADLRCEAVKLDDLMGRIAQAAGPGARVGKSADADFPFLVSIRLSQGSSKKP